MRTNASLIFKKLENLKIESPDSKPYIPSNWKNNQKEDSLKQSYTFQNYPKIEDNRGILRERQLQRSPRGSRNIRESSTKPRRVSNLRRSQSKHLKIPEEFKKENIRPGNFKPFRPSFTFKCGDDQRIKRLEEELRQSTFDKMKKDGEIKNENKGVFEGFKVRKKTRIVRSFSRPPCDFKNSNNIQDFDDKMESRNRRSCSNFQRKSVEYPMVNHRMKFQKLKKEEKSKIHTGDSLNFNHDLEIDKIFNKPDFVKTQKSRYLRSENYDLNTDNHFTKTAEYKEERKTQNISIIEPSILQSQYETEYYLGEIEENQTGILATNTNFGTEIQENAYLARFASKLRIMNEIDNTERSPVFRPHDYTRNSSPPYAARNLNEVILKKNYCGEEEKTRREDPKISMGYTTLSEIQ